MLKLATFSSADNAAALIYQLVQTGLIEAWVSPAMLDEYDDVLDDHPDLLAEISGLCCFCHPLTELDIIRHEPDNRFLECALAAEVDFLVTVNTARGHFDRKNYDNVRVVTPGEFLKLKEVRLLLNKLAED